MENEDIKSICKAVKLVIEGLPVGTEFSGKELKRMVVRILPGTRYKYEDTFLRCARKMCRSAFICISRMKSLYKRVEING